MALDPRTPILVGGGQVNQRDGGIEPVQLIVDAARRAAEEAGSARLLNRIDTVWIVGMLSWRYRDPGALVADYLGANTTRTGYSGNGGSAPQVMVNQAAEDIMAGRSEVVLIGGAESWRTRMKLRAVGERPSWTRQSEAIPLAPHVVPEVPMDAESERRIGLDRPSYVYPLFENAIRSAAGRSISDHADLLGELWANFSKTAASNKYAWIQQEYTAAELISPSPSNRLISSPYTKLLNSNNMVDQGAALIMCSVGAALELGIDRSAWIFPLSGAESHDTSAIAQRGELYRSPAIQACSAKVMELSNINVDDIAYIDLYSCFPSAVQVAANEIGLPIDDEARPLTCTGGLSFAGGPWNNYSTHAISTVAAKLREDPNSYGLITANSGYLTRHALGVYGTKPHSAGYRRSNVQKVVDSQPTTPVIEEFEGTAEIESWTVVYKRDGTPDKSFISALTRSGERTLAVINQEDDLAALADEDLLGQSINVAADGVARLS